MSGEEEEERIADTLEDAGVLEADVGATLLVYCSYAIVIRVMSTEYFFFTVLYAVCLSLQNCLNCPNE